MCNLKRYTGLGNGGVMSWRMEQAVPLANLLVGGWSLSWLRLKVEGAGGGAVYIVGFGCWVCGFKNAYQSPFAGPKFTCKCFLDLGG
jgi:hypothetical protein